MGFRVQSLGFRFEGTVFLGENLYVGRRCIIRAVLRGCEVGARVQVFRVGGLGVRVSTFFAHYNGGTARVLVGFGLRV